MGFHSTLVAEVVNTMRFYLLGLFAILFNYGAEGCGPALAPLIPAALAGAGLITAAAVGDAVRSLRNVDPQVFENVIERIDRALPELGLIENRDKWEDVLMEYGKWADVLNNGNKRSMDCKNCA